MRAGRVFCCMLGSRAHHSCPSFGPSLTLLACSHCFLVCCLQKPTLLLIDDLPGVVGVALNKLHMLMPGIPVEAKLHEGGTVFWSFASLIQDASSNKAAQAHSARRQQPAAAAAVTAAAPPAAAAAAGTAGVFGICGGRFGISRRTIFAG